MGGGATGPCEAEYIRKLTGRLLAALKGVPATAFVHAGRCAPEGLKSILDLWLDAGVELGNHTWSHPDLYRTPAADYEADILKNDAALRPIVAARGKTPRYFRHPMLRVGGDLPTRRRVESFLASHGYKVAPVTLDNSEWMFARAYGRGGEAARRARREYVSYMESIFAFFEDRTLEVVGRPIPHVLLVHANELNADLLPELLAMIRARGYQFVSLEEALADPAYALPDNYAGPGGFSWIHHWSITKGMRNKGEPSEPEWLREATARATPAPASGSTPASRTVRK